MRASAALLPPWMAVVLHSSDVFAIAKTRHQQMYTDVYLLMRYLLPIFAKSVLLIPPKLVMGGSNFLILHLFFLKKVTNICRFLFIIGINIYLENKYNKHIIAIDKKIKVIIVIL